MGGSPSADQTRVSAASTGRDSSWRPVVHDHEVIRDFGHGSYGEVWLARNILGGYRAVKVVHRQTFGRAGPFEREFAGIQSFEPISRSHEGLVDILQVGKNDQDGYFYYVMELADDQAKGRQIDPSHYTAKTLSAELKQRGRLSLEDCLQVGLTLSSALEHMHKHGLVHRDIKPSNIIFVDGVPKLADIGLVTDIGQGTFLGTEGFIPPEGPGKPTADLYSLGKVLYEIVTGKDRLEFPALPTAVDEMADRDRLLQLNEVILRACQNDVHKRYQTAQQMHDDLQRIVQGKRVEVAEVLETLPNNLPRQLTSFVGRQRETDEIKQLLQSARLLTLTGAGGCGKTRLALQVATDLLGEFTDGVWLIELAPVTDPAVVPQAVATALGIREEPNRPLLATLCEQLRPKHLLFVLDNCEHLLDACAPLAETLLKSCPKLQILATSREALGFAGETTLRVPSLSVPDPDRPPDVELLTQCDAVRLFISRAVAAQPDFAVNRDNAPAVAQICCRLEGIPLAIELAAARVTSLTVEQIASRLADSFRLLTGGRRTALPRQQTLQAAIDWSYALLTDAERALLRRLSVFAGGWTLEAAESVCAGDAISSGEVLELLTHLVNKSLVLADERERAVRYRLLETVRQYGRDKLVEAGEAQPARDRHVEYFVQLAEQAEPQLTGAEQETWLNRLEMEHGNLRSALEWALSQESHAELALRLACAVWWFWWVRSYFAEGRRLLERALDRNKAAPAMLRAKALNGAGALASGQADLVTARTLYEQSLSIWQALSDRQGAARCLNNLGLVAREQCDYAAARDLFRQSLAILMESGDNKYAVATLLNNLGLVAWDQSDYETARSLFEESLMIRRALVDNQGAALSLYTMGLVAREQGDCVTARKLFEESLTMQRSLGDKRDAAWSQNNLGDVDFAEGKTEAARFHYEESLSMFRSLGEKRGAACSLNGLGDIARSRGDFANARACYEQSLEIFRALNDKTGIAVVLCAWGRLAQSEGELPLARQLQEESLTIKQQLGKKQSIAESLEAFALLAMAENDPARAVRLFAAAVALRETIHASIPPCDRADYEHALEQARNRLGEEPFASAQMASRILTLDEAVALALERT